MSEVRVVDLDKLGVSKEIFDHIYSMGEEDGREDAINEVVDIYNSNPDIDAFTLIRNLLKEKSE